MYKVAVFHTVFNINIKSARGVATYFSNFILSLSKICKLDFYCYNIASDDTYGINVIKITPEEKENPDFLKNKGYDFVFGDSNHSYPYNAELKHSHSPMYRENVTRTKFELIIKKIFAKKRLVSQELIDNYQNSLKNLDVLLANSENARQDYIQYGGISPKNVFKLAPCIKIDKEFSYVQQQTFTFGMSAVTFALKGGYTFIQALALLKKKNKKFSAKIIYPGHSDKTPLKILVWLLGLASNIEFLDYQEDMEKFYKTIDCLVVPSREDSFGMVVLEAMANSVPALISNRCGAIDIIKDGINGWVFSYEGDSNKNLCEKLQKILDLKDNLSEVAMNAYETVKEYDIEHHSQKLKQIFDEAHNILIH